MVEQDFSVDFPQPFMKEEKQLLWERGVLGTTTPKSLLNAMFYLNGKNFCLCGGEKHRRLIISQLVSSTPIIIFTQKQDEKQERHIYR